MKRPHSHSSSFSIKEEKVLIKEESADDDDDNDPQAAAEKSSDDYEFMSGDDDDEGPRFDPDEPARKVYKKSEPILADIKKPDLTGHFVPIPSTDVTRLSKEFIYDGERDESLQFPCHQCLWGTDNINYFKEHQLRHKYSTEENLLFYFCPLCEAGYQEWSGLRKHRYAC